MKTAHNTMLALATVAALLAAVTVGATQKAPDVTVTQPGEYVTKAQTDSMTVVVGYRLAATSPLDDWLIVEMALSGRAGKTATVHRSDLFVITPDGTRIPVTDQKTFAESYNSLRSYLRRMMVTRDPLGYFPPLRRYCDLQFLTEPGRKVVFDQVQVDNWRVCDGILAFKLPNGFQPGPWILVIKRPDGEIRMPLDLTGPKGN